MTIKCSLSQLFDWWAIIRESNHIMIRPQPIIKKKKKNYI